MTLSECDALGIETYPDNDGGLWYYNNGSAETVEEDCYVEEQRESKP